MKKFLLVLLKAVTAVFGARVIDQRTGKSVGEKRTTLNCASTRHSATRALAASLLGATMDAASCRARATGRAPAMQEYRQASDLV